MDQAKKASIDIEDLGKVKEHQVKWASTCEVDLKGNSLCTGYGRSSSVVPTNTIVVGGTGSAATDILGVRGTGYLDTLEISIGYGRSSSVVLTNIIVSGGTGSAATDIVGVRGTRSLGMGNTSLETAVGENASDAGLSGGSNVTTRDTKYYKNNVGSDSIRYFQIIVEAVGIIINNDSENSKVFF